MFRNSLLSTLFFCITVSLLAPRIQARTLPHEIDSTEKKPNIVFILADDQGWNGTSAQMHPDVPNSKSDFYQTPNIEKLASRGIRFSQAYSPGPMCSPTRASLQTGKSPAQLGMTNVGGGRRRPTPTSQRLILPPHSSTLSTDEVTIGETLQNAGYATAWFGKFHLGNDGPAAHGYDEHDGPTGNEDGNTDDPENPKDIFGITKRGMAFMEKNVEAEKPFYLQLWHYAVHGPVQSRNETEQAYAARPAGKTHASTSFAGMTEDFDTSIGMILDKIEELKISDNTYVVYMSDHGAGNTSSNAPLRQGKGTLWEGGMRVPLIVSGPGVKAGVFCSSPTVGWDLFPTFCELAGVEKSIPEGLEGVSLKPLFETGKGTLARTGNPIAFHFPHYGQASPQSTITIDGFKLVKSYEKNELFLFDLNNDIGEQNDLSKTNSEKTTELHNRLNDYLVSINAGMPSNNPDFDPTAVAESNGRGRAGRRGGQRQGQLAERQKQLTSLEEALTQNDKKDTSDVDLKKVGILIASMRKAFDDSPARTRGTRGGADASSRREQRLKEIEQLEVAYKAGNTKKLIELVAEMKKRMEQRPSRSSGAGQSRK